MNKPLVCCTLVLFSFNLLIGQFGLHIGAGATISDIKTTSDYKTKSLANWVTSVRPEYKISTKLAVSMDVQYAVKGYKSLSETYDFKFHYLDLLPQIEYQPISLLGVVVGGGTSVQLGEFIKPAQGSWQKSISNIYNDLSFTWFAGLRAYPLKKWNMSLLYSNTHLGTIDFTNSSGEYIDTRRLSLGTIQISAGYKII